MFREEYQNIQARGGRRFGGRRLYPVCRSFSCEQLLSTYSCSIQPQWRKAVNALLLSEGTATIFAAPPIFAAANLCVGREVASVSAISSFRPIAIVRGRSHQQCVRALRAEYRRLARLDRSVYLAPSTKPYIVANVDVCIVRHGHSGASRRGW
jgi:hypothetical protein